ncbi:unnamed protein product, partial [Ixodes pacificus]
WADPGGNSVPSRRPLTPASSRKLLQPRADDSRDRRLQKPGSGGPLETGHGPPREPGASACPSLTPWHRKWVAAAGAAAPLSSDGASRRQWPISTRPRGHGHAGSTHHAGPRRWAGLP